MKNKMVKFFKKITLKLILIGFVLLIPNFFVIAFECENNFKASFSLERIIPPMINTSIYEAIIGSELKTKLKLESIGDGLRAEGDLVDVVLVMDRSGSMSGNVDGSIKIEKAKEALKEFVNLISEIDNKGNRLALITYSSDVTLDQVLTSNYASVENKIRQFSASGSTNIGGALQIATRHLEENNNPEARKVIIIASDGIPVGGVPVSTGISEISDDTTVFSVGIGDDVNTEIMQNIANAGNGEGSYYFSNVSDLTEVFLLIVEDIYKPFEAIDVELNFFRYPDNTTKFELKETNPVNDSSIDNKITWLNVGSMKTDQEKYFEIDFLQADGFGTDLSLNEAFVEVKYSSLNQSCTERVPIEVIKIKNQPICLGHQPLFSQLCPGDDRDLTYNQDLSLVASCSQDKKCEYVCQEPFRFDNNKCVLDARCGSLAESSWCRELPLEGEFCSVGANSSPIPIGDNWHWRCSSESGGDNVDCRASRVCGRGWIEVSP